MKKQLLEILGGGRLSPTSRAFILIGLWIVIILVLIWPPATYALLNIINVLPACLTALGSFLAIIYANKSGTRK